MKQPQTEIKVFLASSSELELERTYIGDFFNDINSLIIEKPVRLRLLKWEVFDPLFKGERKQTEYAQQIKKSDIFFVLFHTKAGKYTIEEIKVAKSAHAEMQKPQELYCFFKKQEKREFDEDELKTELGINFITDIFTDINELKIKLIKALSPHLGACGITVAETEMFVMIDSVNILRKQSIGFT